MTDLVERLGDIYATDDHARRCQGREYDCTCGYDERSAATAREAAAEITRLRSLVEEAVKEIDWQDIRLAAGEGPLKGRDVFDAVNVILNDRRHSLLNKMGEA